MLRPIMHLLSLCEYAPEEPSTLLVDVYVFPGGGSFDLIMSNELPSVNLSEGKCKLHLPKVLKYWDT